MQRAQTPAHSNRLQDLKSRSPPRHEHGIYIPKYLNYFMESKYFLPFLQLIPSINVPVSSKNCNSEHTSPRMGLELSVSTTLLLLSAISIAPSGAIPGGGIGNREVKVNHQAASRHMSVTLTTVHSKPTRLSEPNINNGPVQRLAPRAHCSYPLQDVAKRPISMQAH